MIYARLPTPTEWDELARLRRQAVGRVSQRAHLILLSAQHHSVPELAGLFALQPATIRYWIHRFDRLGPAGLDDAPRSGRPRKVSPAVTARLQDLLPRDPRDAGFLATCWTVAMLSLVLVQTLGVTLSARTLRRGRHRLGLGWRRPRLTMPRKTDPAKAAKQWAMVEAVVSAAPETAIRYADEARIQLLPLARAMWQWVGQQRRIPTPGTNLTQTVFGALNIASGPWTYLIRPRARSEDFLAFLEHLVTAHPTGPLLLIVDNFSSHKAGCVKEWLAAHPRLHLYYLPTSCSQLNPVEGIWRHLKQIVAPNRLYGSMALLLETVHTFFAAMTPERALTWAGQKA
jgi:transposase